MNVMKELIAVLRHATTQRVAMFVCVILAIAWQETDTDVKVGHSSGKEFRSVHYALPDQLKMWMNVLKEETVVLSCAGMKLVATPVHVSRVLD